MRYIAEKPDWFDLEDYANLKQLDLDGWSEALCLREAVLERFKDEGLDKPERELIFERQILAFNRTLRVNPNSLGKPFGLDVPSDITTPESPHVNDITHLLYSEPISELATPLTVEEADFDDEDACLWINLEAPDGVLIEVFRKWLREKRKEKPIPVKQTGRWNPENVHIDNRHHLARWIEYQIIPLCDLQLWGQATDIKYTNADFGYLLYPNIKKNRDGTDNDTTDRFRYARRILSEAFEILPYLHVQSAVKYRKANPSDPENNRRILEGMNKVYFGPGKK